MSISPHEKVFRYAIAGSVGIHLLVLGAISVGRPAATASPIDLDHLQVINVEKYEASRHEKVAISIPEPEPKADEPKQFSPRIPPTKELPSTPPKKIRVVAQIPPNARTAPAPPGTRAASTNSAKPGGNPGGLLNMGSNSANGDLAGLPQGNTSVGSVPSATPGLGNGSGTGAGKGSPEPDLNARGNGRETSPPPPPTPTPPPPPPVPKPRDDPPAPVHHNRIADRSMPEAISEPAPTYPGRAQDDGVEGTVRVKYVVGENGSVDSAEIVSSSGNRDLDAAAVAAIKRYRYKPAVQDGIARSITMMRKIVFKLD